MLADGSGADGPGGSQGAGPAFDRLAVIMDRLRRECPWDTRQTHESLAPYLLEETYEALDALELHDMTALREELGDVLLQVFFHARIAAERTDGTGFTINDVAEGIADKLVRRHPHVFGDVAVAGADDVMRNWDAIKAAERETSGRRVSALDGVPSAQPALALAAALLRRAARAGAPAELASLTAIADGPVSKVGAELFSLAARASAVGQDPELELRAAARAFRERFEDWERSEPAGGQ